MKKAFIFLSFVVIVLVCTGFVAYRKEAGSLKENTKVEVKYYLRVVGGHEYLTTVAMGMAPVSGGYGPGTNVSVCTIHSESCPCHKTKKESTKSDFDFDF